MLVTAEPILRRYWHAVAFDTDVGPSPIRRRLLGVDIVLQHQDGVRAAPASTTHGDVAACERYGMVWVCLDPPALGGLPEVPEFADPAYRVIRVGTFHPECSAAAVIDNNTDVTHVPFVHAGTFGAGLDPRVPALTARTTWFGIEVLNETPVATRPGDDSASVRTSVTQMWLPFTQVSRMSFPDGLVHVLVKGVCPIEDKRTAVHLTVLRNDTATATDHDVAAIVALESAIEQEDAAVLSGLPADFPLDVAAQVHGRHDRGGVALRRAYGALLAGQPFGRA